MPNRFSKNRHGARNLEPLGHPPDQGLAAEVVDHRMEPDLRAVSQSNARGVDMPDFVGSARAHTHARTVRMQTSPGPASSPISDEPVPGCRRGQDSSQPLGRDGRPSRRDMPIALGGRHLSNREHLIGGQLIGHRPWACDVVVEGTAALGGPQQDGPHPSIQDRSPLQEKSR